MKKSFLSFLLVTALSILLAACGGGSADNEEGSSGEGEGEGSSDGGTEFVQILTGGTQGTYYPLGGSFANILTSEIDNVEANATSTGASVENMKSMRDGDGQLAFTQTDIASYAKNGEVMFDEAIDNLQAIGTLYPETIQIVTTEDTGIESVEDLEGKVVSVGAVGSGTHANAENILSIHGLSIDEDIEARDLAFDDSTSGIQDGTIDAAFITSGTPTGAVESLAATSEVNIVPVEEDKVQELIEEYGYYAQDEIPEGTYGLEEAVSTVAVQAMLVTDSNLSEDLVYNMTKAIFENTDQVQHSKGEQITAESAQDGVGIEVHPGAQQYFDEQ